MESGVPMMVICMRMDVTCLYGEEKSIGLLAL